MTLVLKYKTNLVISFEHWRKLAANQSAKVCKHQHADTTKRFVVRARPTSQCNLSPTQVEQHIFTALQGFRASTPLWFKVYTRATYKTQGNLQPSCSCRCCTFSMHTSSTELVLAECMAYWCQLSGGEESQMTTKYGV